MDLPQSVVVGFWKGLIPVVIGWFLYCCAVYLGVGLLFLLAGFNVEEALAGRVILGVAYGAPIAAVVLAHVAAAVCLLIRPGRR
jgi:hypothetical protein